MKKLLQLLQIYFGGGCSICRILYVLSKISRLLTVVNFVVSGKNEQKKSWSDNSDQLLWKYD